MSISTHTLYVRIRETQLFRNKMLFTYSREQSKNRHREFITVDIQSI